MPRAKLTLEWAVFSGSEKFEYGDKRPTVLCESEQQAAHMATFWGSSGYYERMNQEHIYVYEEGSTYAIKHGR